MIKLINVSKFIRDNKLDGPITSSQIFLGSSYNFHPKGLMSEEIFGLEGSVERRTSMSWVELNCKVIHPVLYEIISKGFEKKIPSLISGDKSYNIDADGYLVDPPMGKAGEISGFTDFIKILPNLRFRNPEALRGKVMKVMYENINQSMFLIDKLLIISPDYRNVEVRDDGRRKEISTDPLTKLYRRVLEVSIQARTVGGSIFDTVSFQMQLLMRDLYDLVRQQISKKHGMLRREMLGKRVDFSGRAVIIPNPKLNIGETGIPFKMICSLFEPNLIYGLVNSPYASRIPEEFHIEGKKYLGKESMLE